MYTVSAKNALGASITLTGRESEYQIISISGLNPPAANVNISSIAGMDGGVFNSAKLNTREIVLTVRIRGDVERNRLRLYNYFQTKEKITFYFSNGARDVCIDGYILSFECDLFAKGQTAQIAIICPQPYFKALEDIIKDSANVLPLFTFPFSIDEDDPAVISELDESTVIMIQNDSETPTGAEIEIDVYSPCASIEIKNTTSGQDMKLIYSFLAGDMVLINTNTGNKNVRLVRNGTITPIISALAVGSEFMQILPGDNAFEYLIDNVIDTTAVNIIFKYRLNYRGV